MKMHAPKEFSLTPQGPMSEGLTKKDWNPLTGTVQATS